MALEGETSKLYCRINSGSSKVAGLQSSHSSLGTQNNSSRVSKYLRPGTLAQLRDAARNVRAGNGRGRKRPRCEETAGMLGRDSAQTSRIAQSERSLSLPPFCTPINGQRKKYFAPRIPQPSEDENQALRVTRETEPEATMTREETREEDINASALEPETNFDSLPLEMLIRIVCCLTHSELRVSFFVCKRMREAATIARLLHFNYTTPDHHHRQDPRNALNKCSRAMLYKCSAEAATAAAVAAEAAGPGRIAIPAAPRQPPRPMEARIGLAELRKIAAPLFQSTPKKSSSTSPPSSPKQTSRRATILPPGLPRPRTPLANSHRVLFHVNGDDLCCAAVDENMES